jgi:hypothetical protein
MKIHLLAGAAVLALIATVDASAATPKAGAYAAPSQPVAYSKLDTYLKASPTKRAKQDWSLGSTATASAAPTGAAANTSATTGMTPSAAPVDNSAAAPAPSAPAAPPAADSQTAPPAAPDQTPAAPPATGAAPASPGA